MNNINGKYLVGMVILIRWYRLIIDKINIYFIQCHVKK